MIGSYLLLARYQALAGKNKYILIAFNGSLESFSDTNAEFVTIRILPIESTEVIECESNGELTTLPLIWISGDNEIITNTYENLRAFSVSELSGDGSLENDGEGILNILNVLSMMDKDNESYFNTEGITRLLQVLHLNVSDTLINYKNSNANLYALKILPISTDDVETRTYIDAQGHSDRLVFINANTLEIKDYSDTNINLNSVLIMDGGMESEQYGIADIVTFLASPLDSTSSEYTKTLSTLKHFLMKVMSSSLVNYTQTETGINMLESKICGSDEESNTESIANMKLWVLPVVWGDTLLLHQAVDAIQTGNTLEVI